MVASIAVSLSPLLRRAGVDSEMDGADANDRDAAAIDSSIGVKVVIMWSESISVIDVSIVGKILCC